MAPSVRKATDGPRGDGAPPISCAGSFASTAAFSAACTKLDCFSSSLFFACSAVFSLRSSRLRCSSALKAHFQCDTSVDSSAAGTAWVKGTPFGGERLAGSADSFGGGGGGRFAAAAAAARAAAAASRALVITSDQDAASSSSLKFARSSFHPKCGDGNSDTTLANPAVSCALSDVAHVAADGALSDGRF